MKKIVFILFITTLVANSNLLIAQNKIWSLPPYHLTNNGIHPIPIINQNRLAKYSNPYKPTTQWNDNALSLTYNLFEEYDDWSLGMGNDDRLLIYQLPDQIDGMDYIAHFAATLDSCISQTPFDIGIDNANHEQSGTQNWTTSVNPFSNSDTITVRDELIIKSGANITANNLRFEFAPDAKLTIERGAKFTANNCVFTVNTVCDSTAMWNGIEVCGPTNGQQSAGAGKLILNNSTIEHSYLGAHNYKTYLSGTPGVFYED